MKQTMMLIQSAWDKKKTFKLISIDKDCPYNEGIYDPDTKVLAVISKEKKDTFQMVPKFDDKGDVVYVKSKPRPDGKTYAEERRILETYYEYYIESPEEIKDLIKMFCVNSDTFDYDKYLNPPVEIKEPLFEGPTTY